MVRDTAVMQQVELMSYVRACGRSQGSVLMGLTACPADLQPPEVPTQ